MDMVTGIKRRKLQKTAADESIIVAIRNKVQSDEDTQSEPRTAVNAVTIEQSQILRNDIT